MGTPDQRFLKWLRVARLFIAKWIRGVISRRSETDHYRCPLFFLLFRGGRELPHGGYKLPGTLIERGKQIEKETLDLKLGQFAVSSVLIL